MNVWILKLMTSMPWLNNFIIAAAIGGDKKLSDAKGEDFFDASKYPEIVKFYTDWSPHLKGNIGIIHDVAGTVSGGLLSLCFRLTYGAEQIFNQMFKLLGWEGQSSGVVGNIQTFMNIVGWALIALSLIVLVVQSTGHAVKWSSILPNVIMVGITMSALPALMSMSGNGFGSIASAAFEDVQGTGQASLANTAAIPFRENIIDMARVANQNWAADPETIKGSSGKDAFNAISKNPEKAKQQIERLDLTARMNKDTLDSFKGLKDNKMPNGDKVSDPFKYRLLDNSNDNSGKQGESAYKLIEIKGAAGLGEANDWSYDRYSINWLPLIGQCIILVFAFVVAAFRIVKDVFELSLMQLVAPILAYQSIKSTKKFRDLINSMIGMYMSIVLLALSIKVFIIFLNAAPKLIKIEDTFQNGVAICILYAGATYAMFAGVSYFERVTGVSQGFSDSAGQMMAAGALGAAAGGFATNMVMKGGSKALSWGSNKLSSNSNGGINMSSQNSTATGVGAGSGAGSASGISMSKSDSQNNGQSNTSTRASNQSNNKASNQSNNQSNSNNTAHSNSDNNANSATSDVRTSESNNSGITANNGQSDSSNSSTDTNSTIDQSTNDGGSTFDNSSSDGGINVDSSSNDGGTSIDNSDGGISYNNDNSSSSGTDFDSGSDYGYDTGSSDFGNDYDAGTDYGADYGNGYNAGTDLSSDYGNGYDTGLNSNGNMSTENNISYPVDPSNNPVQAGSGSSSTYELNSRPYSLNGGTAGNSSSTNPMSTSSTQGATSPVLNNHNIDSSISNPTTTVNTSRPSSSSSTPASPSFRDNVSSAMNFGSRATGYVGQRGKVMQDMGRNYLKGRNFNLSQRGNVHGVDSDRFDGE